MLSPWPCYRFDNRVGTTVWRCSLTRWCLASLLGSWGSEVIKNTVFPSATPWRVSGLLSLLWRCRLSGFPPYEVSRDKIKILYQHVCHLSTIPSVFSDKTCLASWLEHFSKAWMISVDVLFEKRGKKENIVLIFFI